VVGNFDRCPTDCGTGFGGTGEALTPGVGSQEVTFDVTNHTSSAESLTGVTAAMTTDAAGGISNGYSPGSPFVDACQASWFSLTVYGTGALPASIPAGETYKAATGDTLAVVISMPANDTVNQSACENLSPEVMVSVS
jgi:hypothetical protein